MPPPIPRCSSWAYSSLISPSHFSLPRYGSRVGPHIVLFEACLAFTRVAACTLALSPIRDTLIEGFSHFVTSMTAPIASGWSGCRVGLALTGKRRLVTAPPRSGHGPGFGPRARQAALSLITIHVIQHAAAVPSVTSTRVEGEAGALLQTLAQRRTHQRARRPDAAPALHVANEAESALGHHRGGRA